MSTSVNSAAVAVALALACSSANAASFFQIEAGISSSNYATQGDGTWFQQGLPHVLNIHTYGFSAGFTGALYDRDTWGVDWHVDYVNLGHVSSTCECTPQDSNYDFQKHVLIVQPGWNAPMANFVGNGNAQGVAFTLEPWMKYRGWRFGFEAGLFPYRPAWDETIYGWQVDPNTPQQTIHANTPHALQLGEVAGVNVGRGNFTIGLKHYWLPTKFDNSHNPAIWKGAWVMEAKYRF
jgi:hypothetical protein